MMHPAVIPKNIRDSYRKPYLDLLCNYNLTDTISSDYNESDPNEYRRIIQAQIEQMLKLLADQDHPEKDLADLVAHCRRWDQVYGYNATELYPELADMFKNYGY